MMDFIRRYQKIIFWIVLITMLFAIFAYFGAGGILTKNYDTVAIVNNQKVSYSDFLKEYDRTVENERDRKKDVELTEADLKQIKVGVLQDMISEEALTQIAKRYGLTVTDAEVAANIQNIPAFQKNGHFDHATYFQVLRYGIKMSFQDFENSRRRALMVDKVRFLVSLLSKVTDKEAEMQYLARNGNMKHYAKDKDKFIQTLQNEKRTLLFNQWIAQIQQKTKIQEFLSKFEQAGQQ